MRRHLPPALLVYIVFGCGAEHLPPPITDLEIHELGVSQGIAGRSAAGECIGACRTDCSVYPLPVRLFVLDPEPRLVVDGPAKVPPLCQIPLAGSTRSLAGFRFTESDAPPAIEQVQLGDKDEFAVALAPGNYQLLLVDDSGCASCQVQERSDGVTRCGLVTVAPGAVTHTDLVYLLNVD